MGNMWVCRTALCSLMLEVGRRTPDAFYAGSCDARFGSPTYVARFELCRGAGARVVVVQSWQPDAGVEFASARRAARSRGSAITLETSETLFDLAVGLNACGYDADLANSNPVRAEVRADVEAALAESALNRASRTALCQYVDEHRLSDSGRSLAQYVSLALYVGPPPGLRPGGRGDGHASRRPAGADDSAAACATLPPR